MGMFFVNKQLDDVNLDSIIEMLMEYSAILSVIVTSDDGLIYCADKSKFENEEIAAECVDFFNRINVIFKDNPRSLFFTFNEKDLYIKRIHSLIFIVEMKPNTMEMVKLRLKNVFEKNIDIIKHFDLS